MSYIALYRAYRPNNFKSVVGQSVIVKTLQNALKNNHIAHAYLFSGPRGTGKTTFAKIFAKALNCEEGITGEPCCKCSTCESIKKGTNSDVIEIDAASNNGVDDIREIRDKVKYLPSSGRYKVYIIDEVHMLSTGAFNALLKTLEEPPAHVIFILATTEHHKIPATILSRVQRFDFKGISHADMKKRLQEIINEEKIEITDEAIDLICEVSNGGMRDAISLLDQAVSFTTSAINAHDIHNICGSLNDKDIVTLFTNLAENKKEEALANLDSLLEEGKDISKIITNLVSFLKDLLIYKNARSLSPKKSIHDSQEFKTMLDVLGDKKIYLYLETLNDCLNQIKWTNQKKAYLELALFKMTDKEKTETINYVDRINYLEDKLSKLEKVINQIEKGQNSIPQKKIEPIEEKCDLIYQEADELQAKEFILSVVKNNNRALRSELNQKIRAAVYYEDNPRLAQELSILGSIGAICDGKLVLVFENEIQANKFMLHSFKENIIKIFAFLGYKIKDYVAISQRVLNEITANVKLNGLDKLSLDTIKIGIKYDIIEKEVEDDLTSYVKEVFKDYNIEIKEK